jgi:L,D-peptidoglycan transpeptidase YkuD (ErfK/YbiS/YcfS/YnhG family)
VLTPTGLRYLGRSIPVTWGRGGITTTKREGDLCTPAGILTIIGTMYRPDRVAPRDVPPWAIPIGLEDRWCDDPGHHAYNHLVHKPFGPTNERLRRADPLYDIVMLTDWNWPLAIPHAGSAIFLHRWRRPGYPTAGCLAFDGPDLAWIANRAVPGTRLVIGANARRHRHAPRGCVQGQP